MTTTAAAPTRTTTPVRPAIISLAVGGFAIGTIEFMTMGLLPQVADGVGISIPTGGHLISAYAVGVVVGAPVLAVLGARLPRKSLLIALMGAYALFNVLSALTSSYPVLMGLRFLSGLPHGAFFGFASLAGASLVRPERRARAVASVMLGLSLANVAGVPAATFVGQQLGWRAAFVAASAIAVVSAVLIARYLPATPADVAADGRSELRVFRNGQFLLTLLAGAIGFGGLFAVFSYISPTVTELGGLGEGAVPWFLLAFGLGMTLGGWLAGELGGVPVFVTLIGGTLVNVVALLVFGLLAPHGWWALPALFVVSAVNMTVVINLQLRLMHVAGTAAALGAAMNHSSINVANALGAWLGGLTLAAGYGYRSTSVVGALLCLGGVVVLVVSWRLARSASAGVPRP